MKKKVVMRLQNLRYCKKGLTMSKYILVLASLFVMLSCTKESDSSKFDSSKCIKGKLVLKGICMNYVIEVVSGTIDPSLIESTWENPLTRDVYKNVFGLASTCTFPPNINEGDEFYFTIPQSPLDQSCAVCLAYSPIPTKTLFIELCAK
jgi:hypothetical protein